MAAEWIDPMSDPNIATIVPFYNRRRTIVATLDSVAAQTLPTGRLIVIDDGSTDGGAEFVLSRIKRFPPRVACRLVVQPNQGVSAARNRGLALAENCEYVAFLDSDDVWPSDFLERTFAALDANANAVAATCDCRVVNAGGDVLSHCDCSRLVNGAALWMLDHGANIASASLFRAQTVRRRGGFNQALRTGEDSALFMPLSLDGPWLYAKGEPVVFQRGRAETFGDAGNLSFQFSDNHRTWARIHESFFVYGEGRAIADDPGCRRLLARSWYQAGRELFERNAPREAVACFHRAVHWQPWRAKYHLAAWRAWRSTVFGPPTPPRSTSNRGTLSGRHVVAAR